jgi:hypothetical protein
VDYTTDDAIMAYKAGFEGYEQSLVGILAFLAAAEKS